MIRGLYTAASGMLTQQQRHDSLTNDLANINTPAYKANQGMIRAFPEVYLNAIRVPSSPNKKIGQINQGVFIEENVTIFTQGDLQTTGVSTHMAIWDKELEPDPDSGEQPKLFFTLEDENGDTLYTRDGLFMEDPTGYLVTPEGHLVLDNLGLPIEIYGRDFKINEKGQIIFANGDPTISVGLTKVNNSNLMIKQGNQIYRYDGDQEDLAFIDTSENYNVLQGKIERSNVDPTQTMVDMMSALRSYEANQKVIQSLDQSLEKAVNEIGKV